MSLLHVSASVRGEASHSRRFGGRLVRRLCGIRPMPIVERDLAAHPPSYPGPAFVEASLMAPAERGPAQFAALAESEALIGEVEAASLVVIDTPMHNFTVPASLKSWIDHLVRPGRTFQRGPAGKQGLLADRPVFLLVACGGPVSGAGGQTDFVTPYLRYVLATIGLHDLVALRLESLLRGGGAGLGEAEAEAGAWIEAAAARWANGPAADEDAARLPRLSPGDRSDTLP